MDEIIPWDEVVALIEPYYYKNTRGRKALPIETMFRMFLLQIFCCKYGIPLLMKRWRTPYMTAMPCGSSCI